MIFNPRSPSTPEDYQDRKKHAFNVIQFCPNYLNTILGGEVNNGLVILLEILQNPHYNKQVKSLVIVLLICQFNMVIFQLTYNLLDTILTEMFPELNDTVGS